MTFLKKHKLKIIGSFIVLGVLSVSYRFYQAQPKSILSVVKAEFQGYDGYGTLDYNTDEINQEINKIIYQSVGFSKNQIEDIMNDDSVIMTDIYSDSDLTSKFNKAKSMISTLSYSFNKSSNLKNGDKVTFSIKSTSSQSPIKKESKTFEVKGLEKTTKLSTKDLLEMYPVTFSGFNNYGKVILPETENGLPIFENLEGDRGYSNGDQVSLKVTSNYLETLKNEGKRLESKTVTVDVSGLKEFTEISNVSDALKKNDDYAKSDYENTSYASYTLEKQADYIRYGNGYYDDYESSGGQIYLISIYKISKIGSDGDNNSVFYRSYGYRYYVKSDGSLDLSTANKESGSSKDDYDNLIASIKTDNYQEYKLAVE